MPLFEYVCRACDKQFTFLSGVVAQNEAPRCPRCDSADLQKLMSRFRRGRSDDERLESVAQKMETSDLDDESVARHWVREMGREIESETGESFGDELESLIDEENRHESNSSNHRDDGRIY